MFRKPLIRKYLVYLVILASYGISTKILCAAKQHFRWQNHPSAEKWHEFQDLSSESRLKAWYSMKDFGWDKIKWKWKLALIVACDTNINQEFCKQVMILALKDKALVVRAQSASLIAKAYHKNPDSRIISLLEKASANSNNYRGGEPLYVQYRIIHALHEIGGAKAAAAARHIATAHKKTYSYWSKLTKKL